MSRRRSPAVIAFLLVQIVLAGESAGQTLVLSDSNFLNSDWSDSVVTLPDQPGALDIETRRVSLSGLTRRQSSFEIFEAAPPPLGDHVVLNLYTRRQYVPSVEGAIARVHSTLVARTYHIRNVTVQILGGTLLRQGTKFYWSRNAQDRVPLPLAAVSTPTTVRSTLTQSDFAEVGAAGEPDFSVSGDPISFGYFLLFRVSGRIENAEVWDAGAEVLRWEVGIEREVTSAALEVDISSADCLTYNAGPGEFFVVCTLPARPGDASVDVTVTNQSPAPILGSRLLARAHPRYGDVFGAEISVPVPRIDPGSQTQMSIPLASLFPDFARSPGGVVIVVRLLGGGLLEAVRNTVSVGFQIVAPPLPPPGDQPCNVGCEFARCILVAVFRLPVKFKTSSLLKAGPFDLGIFYRMRDEVFELSSAGRRYRELFYAHTGEMARIVLERPSSLALALSTILIWQEPLRALVERRGSEARLDGDQIQTLQSLLDDFKEHGSPELRAVITREEQLLNLSSYQGMDMASALSRFERSQKGPITLPAVASLRGISPSFFQSDVHVFNPSSTDTATVTATYRCSTGSCGSSEGIFTVGPRQMRTFRDMAGTFFAAPGSAGAIEFEGDVIVNSRLYTPSRPLPSDGMFIPGLGREHAHAASLLLSLAWSPDFSRGFRTNVGAYNPNDETVEASFIFFRNDGTRIGTVVRSIPARTPLQINNSFAEAGALTETEGYCVVMSDGIRPLFAYASVIDNRSTDPIFVRGLPLAGSSAETQTLAAAASIHGAANTFFHSDVTLLNPSAAPLEVLAAYRCMTGECGESVQTFTLAGGELRSIKDAVATLFGAPETAGALVFQAENLLVSSRLYTPLADQPTRGMYIPAFATSEASEALVLTSLSHSPDIRAGFRTNAGVFNPGVDPADVTLSLFSEDGTLLGTTQAVVPPARSVQINGVFGVAGITTEVENGYSIVTTSNGVEILAYASVIDNRSSDSIFVTGVRLGQR